MPPAPGGYDGGFEAQEAVTPSTPEFVGRSQYLEYALFGFVWGRICTDHSRRGLSRFLFYSPGACMSFRWKLLAEPGGWRDLVLLLIA